MIRRLLPRIALLTLIATAGSLLAASPADAAVTRKVDTLNICGRRCNALLNKTMAPVDMLDYLEAIASPKPAIITLSEVCVSQYVELVNNRGFNQTGTGRGYAYYFQAVDSGTWLGTNCGNQFGNVLFIRGSNLSAPFEQQMPTQGSSGTDKVICVTSTYGTLQMVGCSTHLDANRDISYLQVAELEDIITWFFNNQRRFVGGDFNSTSRRDWPTLYLEGDPSSRYTWNTEVGVTQKIDYTWANRAHQQGTPSSTVGCNTWPTTDHCYLSSNFNTI